MNIQAGILYLCSHLQDNFVKGGRRPRSSMSPTIFYNNDTKCDVRGFVGGVGAMKIIPGERLVLPELLFGLG